MTAPSDIWADEASLYSQTRPSPPTALLDILTQLIHTSRPTLVVDLGCGTGLSTIVWSKRAERVIGVEPSDAMRRQAMDTLSANPRLTNITYQAGAAQQTGLADNSVDVVTCAQSFHWMEPSVTLAEVARILRPGGIFAAYDYDWPPVVGWELEQVYREVDEHFELLVKTRGHSRRAPKWPKEQHLERIRASGQFRFTRELMLHHREDGNATRFVGLILTNGYGYQIRQGTVTEEDLQLERLKEAAHQYIGSTPIPWYFSYRVRIGIK